MLNERSIQIFKHIVEAYVETGDPIGSETLSHRLGISLSSATIRNIMARLEEAGLLYSPHTSAGRLPTEAGLNFFVHGVMEVGGLTDTLRVEIESQCKRKGLGFEGILKQATSLLSGLTQTASLVIAPKMDSQLKQIEFIPLDHQRALVVLVTKEGLVENRLINIPKGLPINALQEASNYMNHYLCGMTLQEAEERMKTQMAAERNELNELTNELIQEGLAAWVEMGEQASLIVHGQANLLGDIQHMADLDRIKNLMSMLETQEGALALLKASQNGDGVQIFIGAQNALFDISGCSLVIAPFKNAAGYVIGSLGVIGPARMNYGRIIPMVDYTAGVISRLI